MRILIATLVALMVCTTKSWAGAHLSGDEMHLVANFATDICGSYEQKGQKLSASGKADVGAKLSQLLKHFADINASGALTLDIEKTSGLIQSDLVTDRQNVRNCRSHIADTLSTNLTAKPSSGSASGRAESDIAPHCNINIDGLDIEDGHSDGLVMDEGPTLCLRNGKFKNNDGQNLVLRQKQVPASP